MLCNSSLVKFFKGLKSPLSIDEIKKIMIKLNNYNLLICSSDKPDRKISSENYLNISNELTNKKDSTFILIKQI